jgi:rare lipoprotein A
MIARRHGKDCRHTQLWFLTTILVSLLATTTLPAHSASGGTTESTVSNNSSQTVILTNSRWTELAQPTKASPSAPFAPKVVGQFKADVLPYRIADTTVVNVWDLSTTTPAGRPIRTQEDDERSGESALSSDGLVHKPLTLPKPVVGKVPPAIGKSVVAHTANELNIPASSVANTTTISGRLLDTLPERYWVASRQDGGVPTQIDSVTASDGATASVLINEKEVIRFRSSLRNLDPSQRSKQAANRLQAFLKNQGTYQAVGVHRTQGRTEIRLGSAPFVLVDRQTALLAGMSEDKLARAWARQVRQSLGEPEALTVANLLPTSVRSTGRLIAGMASYYGPGFHGRLAADGSRFNQNAMTAAHKTLPFGTLVKVTNQRSGQTCVVRITDRGPFIAGRVIDLSVGAARAIGMLGSGVARVTLEVVR